MGRIESHRDMIVWQKAMDLEVDVYRLCSSFPPDERFRLTSQITRAASSVPANIAEGHARASRRDYAYFLAVAEGSLMETETFLTLAVRLHYLSNAQAEEAQQLITEISKMITALRSKLVSRSQ